MSLTLVCVTLCSFKFCYHLDEVERAGCFAFIAFWMSCYCKYYVVFPHGAIGWYAVLINSCLLSQSFSPMCDMVTNVHVLMSHMYPC